MSQVCHRWHRPKTCMEMGWQAFLFVRLWVLWTGYPTGTGGPVQLGNPLENRIAPTSPVFRKGACGGSPVSHSSPPGPQIRPIMKQFASGHLGVKHSTVQQLLSWVWVWLLQIPAEEGELKRHPMAMLQRDWDMNPDPYKDLIAHGVSILELPGTCRREKCYVKWGCCSRMQRMSWTLPEIAYQLLGAQVRPPTLFWKKLFVQLLLSSKLFANPLKSKSQSQLDFPCPGVGKWGQPPAMYPGDRAPTIHRVHYQQPDLFTQNWKLKHRKRAWDVFLSTMNSLGNGHFSSHLNLCSVFISHNAYTNAFYWRNAAQLAHEALVEWVTLLSQSALPERCAWALPACPMISRALTVAAMGMEPQLEELLPWYF